MSKVILFDFGIFSHSSVFTSVKCGFFAPWLCTKSMLGCLQRIELHPDDIVIVAVDAPNNWRKVIDPAYKSNRAAARAKTGIDWDKHFADFDRLLEQLNQSSIFNILRIDKLEADDIIAYACRFYKDKECIIISTDSDFEQLEQFPNVKIFSPKSKKYKIVKHPERVVAKKIHREKTDNLVTPILNQKDYDRRNTLVNLTVLPKEVEQLIESVLITVQPKIEYDLSQFPFKNLIENMGTVFENEKKEIVTYSHSFSKKEKRKETKTLEF